MSDAERRLARALAWMCQQYLMRNGKLAHDFMSAGEDALEILAEHGFVELEAGGGIWTKAGDDLLDED